MFFHQNKKGFTLIELLVVISIIGLLASVVLVAVDGARQKARDAKRLYDIRQIASALDLFYNDNLSYPTTNAIFNTNNYHAISAPPGGLITCGTSQPGCLNGTFFPQYLSKVPVAPLPADSSPAYNCASAYAGGIANDYQFAGSGGATLTNYYTMTFCLGSTVNGFSPGIHTATPTGIQ